MTYAVQARHPEYSIGVSRVPDHKLRLNLLAKTERYTNEEFQKEIQSLLDAKVLDKEAILGCFKDCIEHKIEPGNFLERLAIDRICKEFRVPTLQQFISEHVDGGGIIHTVQDLTFDLTPAITFLARPWRELWSHVKAFQLPSWSLVARAIKVLALSIFRWHFYDRVLLKKNSDQTVIHSLNGKIERVKLSEIQKSHPWLIDNCKTLILKEKAVEHAPCQVSTPLFRSQSVVEYYQLHCKVTVTNKAQGNRVADLLRSKAFLLL